MKMAKANWRTGNTKSFGQFSEADADIVGIIEGVQFRRRGGKKEKRWKIKKDYQRRTFREEEISNINEAKEYNSKGWGRIKR